MEPPAKTSCRAPERNVFRARRLVLPLTEVRMICSSILRGDDVLLPTSGSLRRRARMQSMREGTGVSLSRVAGSEKNALRQLLSEYLVELAETEGVAVTRDSEGVPTYRWFHEYWTDSSRLPFFISAHGKIAGFCLVRRAEPGWIVAELGVGSEWRRHRVGSAAVESLADEAQAAGVHLLLADVHEWNTRALKFWASCGFAVLREANGVIAMQRGLTRRS